MEFSRKLDFQPPWWDPRGVFRDPPPHSKAKALNLQTQVQDPEPRIPVTGVDPGPAGRFPLDLKETGFSTPHGGIREFFPGPPPLTLKLKL